MCFHKLTLLIVRTYKEQNTEPARYSMEVNGFQTNGSELRAMNSTDLARRKSIPSPYLIQMKEFLLISDMIVLNLDDIK